MAFIDEITFHGQSGRGRRRRRPLENNERAKGIRGGAGGNGGRGGDIYVRAIRDLSILNRYRNAKAFESDRGEDGMRKQHARRRREGSDIDLPIGAIVTDLSTGRTGQPAHRRRDRQDIERRPWRTRQ